MASIYKELLLDTSADTAWAALRRAGDARALFSPVLVDSRVAGDIRTVRFANGSVVEERIITIDDDRRRIVYAAEKGTPMTHHHASMQVIPEGGGRCRFVWITDFLPESVASSISQLIDGGSQALKANLERTPHVPS
jgi:hypothetical protein